MDFLLHMCLLFPLKQEGIPEIAAAMESPKALHVRNTDSVGVILRLCKGSFTSWPPAADARRDQQHFYCYLPDTKHR